MKLIACCIVYIIGKWTKASAYLLMLRMKKGKRQQNHVIE